MAYYCWGFGVQIATQQEKFNFRVTREGTLKSATECNVDEGKVVRDHLIFSVTFECNLKLMWITKLDLQLCQSYSVQQKKFSNNYKYYLFQTVPIMHIILRKI